MNGQDWLNYWQAQAAGDGEKRKADWLDAVTGALGAGVGLVATGGNPAGAMAGWNIGKSVGNVGENAVNHTLTPGNVMGDAMGGIGAYSGYQNGLTPISPQDGGTQPDLPMPMPGGGPGEDLLARLLGQYPMMGFAEGGEVQPQPQQPQGPTIRTPQDAADFLRGLEEAINGMPGSTYTPEAPKHPTLEMLASVVPDVVKALPAPRQTNSVNKTVGAWLPAAATAFSAPINYGKAQREDRNKKGSEAAKALADHRWSVARSLVDSLDTRKGDVAAKAQEPMVSIPGVGDVPATSGLARGYLEKTRPELFPKPASETAKADKASQESMDANGLADEIAGLRADPTKISTQGRSAQFGAQVTALVNQKLKASGSPYTLKDLQQMWQESDRFSKSGNSQRFMNLRQSAAALRAHMDQFEQFYNKWARPYRNAPAMARAGNLVAYNNGVYAAAKAGLLGQQAQQDAVALDPVRDAVKNELPVVLAAGYAPQERQYRETDKMLGDMFNRQSNAQRMKSLKGVIETRLNVYASGTPFRGGRKNPYLMDVSPIEGWQQAAPQEPHPNSGWKPPGAVHVGGQ